ncbi:alpha/beta fold hydrolase [Actinospica robiniae]|uniref:alpha/beta fold hydrolase n=1 Tax=Actinospica robiniae TaxID=304901 RepID=UPI000428062B|nr:alpha/beta hydrolase [Actinospica robiniae]
MVPTFLLLHGGGGPATVSAFADLLAAREQVRVLAPTHPGFAGTDRPEHLASVAALARHYADYLDEQDAQDVIVVGSSLGGWIAAELALLGSPRVHGAVLVNAVGIEVDGHPVAQVAGLSPRELARLSFHNPALSPAANAPAGRPAGPGPDIRALTAYAGPTMSDPTLRERLAKIEVPVTVVWGESDGIVDVAFGRAYAEAIPGARFVLLPETGHLPTVESPERLLAVVRA